MNAKGLITCLAAVLILIVCSRADATPYSSAVLADNPLAYWRLNDAGPGATDLTGNGHNGTASGPGVQFGQPGLLPGDFETAGTSIRTPAGGAADRIVVPGFEKFAGGSGYTVEYWMVVNNQPPGFANIVGDGESGGDFYFMNYLTSAGQIRPHYSFANTPVSTDSNTVLTPGTTYYVVTTWDRTTGDARIYITPDTANSVILDKVILTTMNVPSNTNNQIFIGRDNREPGGDFFIDEVAFYNFALSPDRIQAHFDAAFAQIPEPSTGSIALLGLAGWLGMHRRNRCRRSA